MHARPATDDEPRDAPRTDARPPVEETVRTETLLLRNYDPHAAYDLSVAVGDETPPAFAARYHLRPGQIETVSGVLASGEYEVTVELHGHREKTAACRVGSAPEDTIHVEVGNGIVSVTQGLF